MSRQATNRKNRKNRQSETKASKIFSNNSKYFDKQRLHTYLSALRPNDKTKIGKQKFWIKEKDTDFRCRLKKFKCSALTKEGKPCGRQVVHGLPACYQHTLSIFRVRRNVSTLPGPKMYGLFACDPSLGPKDIVFRKNEEIVPYFGDVLTSRQLDERYPGDTTAAYALKLSNNKFVDGACVQGIGAKGNKATGNKQNNAKLMPGRRTIKPIISYQTKNYLYPLPGNIRL